MRPVIVTDVRYRTATAVIRPLSKAGYAVWAVQTRAESPKPPATFSSRYVNQKIHLDGSVKEADYAARLLEVCQTAAKDGERPVLFPIGADTLAMLSAHAEQFRAVCDFLVAPPEILARANDKRTVAAVAREIGVPVPQEFDPDGELPPLPVVIKPRCGEKLGLHAEQRYRKAFSAEEYTAAMEKMRAYDPQPIVQTLIAGDGMGVCVVMDESHRPVSAICHRRLREYPISGGPSTCCISVFDRAKLDYAVKLLQALEFVGIAMVEFKGNFVLEINPRIWGSYPLTDACGSRFAENYVRAAAGEVFESPDTDYQRGRRMRFVLNDTLAMLSYLRHGEFKKFFAGIIDIFRAKEAIFRFSDQKPFWKYLSDAIRKGGGA